MLQQFNWLLKICPKFQVLTSYFLEVKDLLNDEILSKENNNISTLIYVQWADIYWSKVSKIVSQPKFCRQEFWCILFDLNIHLAIQKWNQRFHPPAENILTSPDLLRIALTAKPLVCIDLLKKNYIWIVKSCKFELIFCVAIQLPL